MKCVCPMGGDRTCPDDCLLAVWANLSATDRKAQRKSIAEQLYRQNFTMEQIATQLGVTHATISSDLREFVRDLQINKHTKTATNPKGAGRPKGSRAKPERRKNELPTAQTAAEKILDAGKTYPEMEKETGLSNTVLRSAVAREEGRREAEPVITPDMLSMTAQQKLESAIKQYKEKLKREFYDTVNARVQTILMETTLPKHRKEQAEARKLMERRAGLMTKATFNTIRRALHPDSRLSISDKLLSEAFDAFMALEKRLLSEKDSPTDFQQLPDTWEGWMAMRRKPKERSSKHSNIVKH